MAQGDGAAVPPAFCTQKVPAGQSVTLLSGVPALGQYVPEGQPVQAAAEALL